MSAVRAVIAAAALMLSVAPAAIAAPPPGSLHPVSSSPCLSEPSDPSCAHHASGVNNAVGSVVSRDGRFVYVAGYGSNAIAELARAANGSLTPLPSHPCIVDADHGGESCPDTAHGLGGVTALAITPDGKYLYAASQASGGGAVAWFARQSDGSLIALGCRTEPGGTNCGSGNTAKGLSGAVGVAVSPDGNNVYVAAANGNDVAEFARQSNGSLTAVLGDVCIGFGNVECPRSSPGLTLASGLALSADGRYLYVAAGNDVAELLRHSDGALSAISAHPCIQNTGGTDCGAGNTGPGLTSVMSVAISPDQQNVYAGGGQALAELARRADGSLKPVPSHQCIDEPGSGTCTATATGLDGVDSLAVSPDGDEVYAHASDPTGNPGSIAILARAEADGSLSQPAAMPCVMDPSSNQGCPQKVSGLIAPGSLTISSDGRNLYGATGLVAELARTVDFPSLARAAITPRHFRVAHGATISWVLSAPARITFTFVRSVPGRRVQHKCVNPNRHNREKPRCTQLITRGSFSLLEPAGPGKLVFNGRLRGRALAPGVYELLLSTRGHSAQPIAFRVLKP